MPRYDLLASTCPPGQDCPKIIRLRPGILTVVGSTVTAEADLLELGVHAGESAVDISEELLRAAYAALERERT